MSTSNVSLRDTLLAAYQSPHWRDESLGDDEIQVRVFGLNCSDRLYLSHEQVDNRMIIRYRGTGCVIHLAVTDLLLRIVNDNTPEVIRAYLDGYISLINGGNITQDVNLSSLILLRDSQIINTRKPCLMLVAEALELLLQL